MFLDVCFAAAISLLTLSMRNRGRELLVIEKIFFRESGSAKRQSELTKEGAVVYRWVVAAFSLANAASQLATIWAACSRCR